MISQKNMNTTPIISAHSYYSLRYGTLSIENLVSEAKKHEIETLLLADINNTTATTDFVRECHEQGLRPVAGVACHNKEEFLYTLIACNNKGFREINHFLSELNLNGLPLPCRPDDFDNVIVVYPLYSAPETLEKHNEYVGIQHWELNRLVSSPWRHCKDKLLAWHNVTFTGPIGFDLHRHLRAIDNNCLLAKLPPGKLAHPEQIFLNTAQLQRAFAYWEQLLINSARVLSNCEIDFDFTVIKNKKTFTGSKYDDRILLEKLASDGLIYRYGKYNKEALRRVKHELEIIDKLGFSAYFLITWDIIRYSMSRGFYHVGRGSGANSIVAYCLRITDVDPIALDLYFERFINPLRTSPPDFDIDYSWKERDEVLDYIFKRYGRLHTALLGAMSTFKGKSILRELGKVFGLPKNEIDELVEKPPMPEQQGPLIGRLMNVGVQMVDFPNIRSIHAGGVLVSEEPLTCYTALDMPPKAFPTTQWDMYVAEAIGFEKLDILSQRGLGHIDECTKILHQNRGINVDIHRVDEFMKDPQVMNQIRNGETIGCFYIESPAMRGLLKKLHCDTYLILVAASSIIRPGVARSGMMKEYIHRFHNPNGFKYLHPVMEEQLKETFGVMVYQEDVLKVCHHFAGLDLADADILRRAMSGKHRSKKEFERIRNRFFDNCMQRNYPDTTAAEVWRQIESFAGYSFSKAHSASYAVESFQSLYLKAHHPHEFHVAVINNFGGFYSTWVYFNEARRCGAHVELPCVNQGAHKTSLKGNTIFIGFIHVQNLETNVAQSIEKEREKNGQYRSFLDFTNRVPMGKEQLLLLIRINALRFTEKTKQELLWEAHMTNVGKAPKVSPNTLFDAPVQTFELPELMRSSLEDAYDEIELLGWPVTLSYFDMVEQSAKQGILAKEMKQYNGKKVTMAGSLVTIKYVSTIRREIMHFGTFFDREGMFFDTVHFPPVVKKYPFRGKGVYLINGKVVEEFGFASLEVECMEKLPMQKDPRYA